MFELKITANDANELANQVGMLAVALSAAFTPRAAAPVAESTKTVREAFDEAEKKVKAPRAEKGQTIDHDANGGASNVEVEAVVVQPAVPPAETVVQVPGASGGDAEAEAQNEVTAEKTMTFDEMRQYTIAYLNDTIPTAEGRKNEFRSILDVFTAVKLGDIAAEKFPLVIAEVDRRKAAAAAKKAG